METTQHRESWNKDKLIGQKPPLKPKDIWSIQIHLQDAHKVRDSANCLQKVSRSATNWLLGPSDRTSNIGLFDARYPRG